MRPVQPRRGLASIWVLGAFSWVVVATLCGCGGPSPARDAAIAGDGSRHDAAAPREASSATDATDGLVDGLVGDLDRRDGVDGDARDLSSDAGDADVATGDAAGDGSDASDAVTCPPCVAALIRLEADCAPAGSCTGQVDESEDPDGGTTTTENLCFSDGFREISTGTKTVTSMLTKTSSLSMASTQYFKGGALCYTAVYAETVSDAGVVVLNIAEQDPSGATIATEQETYGGGSPTIESTTCAGQSYDLTATSGCPSAFPAATGPTVCNDGPCL